MIFTRETLTQNTAPTFKDLDVPEWGGVARLRKFGVAEMLAFQAKARQVREENPADAPGLMALAVVIATLVDENGAPIFQDTAADREALGRLDPAGFMRVFAEASKLCGITPDAVKEAEGN